MQASLIFIAAMLAAAPALADTAYITNEKGNSITVVDLEKLAAVKTVEVGQRPRGIALSKDQKLIYVCLGDDDTIAILDAKTLDRVGDLPSGPDPEQLRLSPDGKLVFDKLSSVFASGNETRDDQPDHLRVQHRVPVEVARMWSHMCPARVYEVDADGDDGMAQVRVNPSNCVQCGAISAKGGRLTPAEGGSGPEYSAT